MCNHSTEQDAIAALEAGEYQRAVDIWRMVGERRGICSDSRLGHSDCLSCFQGRLLFLALTRRDKDFEQLYNGLKAWVGEQGLFGGTE